MSSVIIFFVSFLSGIVLYFWICIHARQSYLREICRGIRGKFTQPKTFTQQLLHFRGSYRFAGQCSQRSLTIAYHYRWRKAWDLQTEAPEDERLEIRFPLIQKFWLRMILDPDHLDHKENIELGNPALDSLYVIHSNQPDAAREFLSSQAALYDLQRLPFPFERLEIHKGWGTVEFYFPERRRFDHVHLDIAVESLARLFTDYETRSKFVIVISVSPDTRCPYCREVLSDARDQIIQCSKCGARLHEICWNENKQCTTWGCHA